MRLGLLVSRTYTGFDRPYRRNKINVKGLPADDCKNNAICAKHTDDDDNISNMKNDNTDSTNYYGDDNDNTHNYNIFKHDDIDNDDVKKSDEYDENDKNYCDDNNYGDNNCNESNYDNNNHRSKLNNDNRKIKFNGRLKIDDRNEQKNGTTGKENIKNVQNNNYAINDVTIRWLDDIYDTYTPSGTKENYEKSFCLTDGCGFISLNLALQLPSYIRQGIVGGEKYCPSKIESKNYSASQENSKNDSNDEHRENSYLGEKNPLFVPAAFQVRIISPLGVFKGTLVTHPTLPGDTIIVRNSMHKVQGPKINKKNAYQSTNSNGKNKFSIKPDIDIESTTISLAKKDVNVVGHAEVNIVNDDAEFDVTKNEFKLQNDDEGGCLIISNQTEIEVSEEVQLDDEKLLTEYNKIMEKFQRLKINDIALNYDNAEREGARKLKLDGPSTSETYASNPTTQYPSFHSNIQTPNPLSSSLPTFIESNMSTVSLQIVNTSTPLKQHRSNLNKHLILLLHHLGVPRHIFESKLR